MNRCTFHLMHIFSLFPPSLFPLSPSNCLSYASAPQKISHEPLRSIISFAIVENCTAPPSEAITDTQIADVSSGIEREREKFDD